LSSKVFNLKPPTNWRRYGDERFSLMQQ